MFTTNFINNTCFVREVLLGGCRRCTSRRVRSIHRRCRRGRTRVSRAVRRGTARGDFRRLTKGCHARSSPRTVTAYRPVRVVRPSRFNRGSSCRADFLACCTSNTLIFSNRSGPISRSSVPALVNARTLGRVNRFTPDVVRIQGGGCRGSCRVLRTRRY